MIVIVVDAEKAEQVYGAVDADGHWGQRNRTTEKTEKKIQNA